MEEWRTCIGWTLYEVSNLGRIRKIGGKELKGWLKDGYVYVTLTHYTERGHAHLAELVLKTFSRPRPPGRQVRHLNDVKTDNRHANLRWGTGKQNYADAVRNGIEGYRENNRKAKLTQAAVDDIRAKMKLPANERRLLKITIRSLATQHGVTKNAVHQVLIGRTWR